MQLYRPAFDKPEKNRNDGKYQQYMYKLANTKYKKTKKPSQQQDDSYKIQ
jgi:hypothetical protein